MENVGDNKLDLKALVSKLEFRDEILNEFHLKFTERVQEWKKLARTAYEGENFNFQLCHEGAWKRLAVVVYLLLEKYEIYLAMGIKKDIIFDTFRDVSLRAGLYYEKTGKSGITEEDVIWFRHIMNVEIFKIGSIQFQCFRMLYLEEPQTEPFYMIYSDGVKKWLTPGTPVINCHIQRGAISDYRYLYR